MKNSDYFWCGSKINFRYIVLKEITKEYYLILYLFEIGCYSVRFLNLKSQGYKEKIKNRTINGQPGHSYSLDDVHGNVKKVEDGRQVRMVVGYSSVV